MKISKSQRSNLIFLIILVVLLFTPIGSTIKEYTARLFSFAPSVEKTANRVVVSNYNWQLKGINVEDLNFDNAKGKVVVINFWATWCPPCRAEMPSFQKLYDAYKEDIIFLFLTNEGSTKVVDFLDKYNYNLPSFNQYTETPMEFPVSSIPATYIVDKEGFIVVDKVGPADWNSDKLKTFLDELLQK